MTLQTLRYNLIDAIMSIDDTAKLERIYRKLVSAEDSSRDRLHSTQGEALPPTLEVNHGVTLDQILASQHVENLLFEDIKRMNEDEVWDQSIEELLASVD